MNEYKHDQEILDLLHKISGIGLYCLPARSNAGNFNITVKRKVSAEEYPAIRKNIYDAKIDDILSFDSEASGAGYMNLTFEIHCPDTKETVEKLKQALKNVIVKHLVEDITKRTYDLPPEELDELTKDILEQAADRLGVKQQHEKPVIDDNSAVARLKRGDFSVPQIR